MWAKASFLIFVGTMFLLIGSAFAGPTARFIAASEPATLVVLRVDQKTSGSEARYRPVFELHETTGANVEYAGLIWSGGKMHEPGDIVEGRYAPETGEMQSNKLSRSSLLAGRIAQLVGLILVLLPVLAPGLVRRMRWKRSSSTIRLFRV